MIPLLAGRTLKVFTTTFCQLLAQDEQPAPFGPCQPAIDEDEARVFSNKVGKEQRTNEAEKEQARKSGSEDGQTGGVRMHSLIFTKR
jgi:hypothetical protein